MDLIKNINQASDLQFNLREEVTKNIKAREAKAAANSKFNKSIQNNCRRKYKYNRQQMQNCNLRPDEFDLI